MPDPVNDRDEQRHDPGGEELWNESWYFDFAAADGSLGGYVRLGLYPALGVSWYWAYLVGNDHRLLAVRHHEAPIPGGRTLEIRDEGLWAALHCETPHDHWTAGLEAFALALDHPAEALESERGDLVPLGFDLEWEASAPAYPYPGVTRYEQSCRVHGEVLIGDETLEIDCWGQRDHSWGVRDWWRFPWTWTAGRLEDGTAFHASRPEIEGVRYEPGYVVSPAGELKEASGFTATTQLGAHDLPASVAMELDGINLDVIPLHHAPVRLDAPDGRVGRLPRALCRFTASDGRTGFGWTEWNQPPPAGA